MDVHDCCDWPAMGLYYVMRRRDRSHRHPMKELMSTEMMIIIIWWGSTIRWAMYNIHQPAAASEAILPERNV